MLATHRTGDALIAATTTPAHGKTTARNSCGRPLEHGLCGGLSAGKVDDGKRAGTLATAPPRPRSSRS